MTTATATMSTDRAAPTTRAAAARGAREMLPFVVGLVPLGLAIGVAVAASPLDDATGLASAPLLFSGSAQASAVDLLGRGAGVLAVVGAVVLLTARFAAYGAALAPGLRDQPRWFRVLAPYFLVEPVVAVVSTEMAGTAPPEVRRAHYLGATVTLWIGWLSMIGLGIVTGPVIDPAWSLDFAAPLCLVAILARRLDSREGAVCAAVAAAIVIVSTQLGCPSSVATLVGMGAAMASALVTARSGGSS
jgi:branched chain amino acid efflux pump